MKPNDLIVDNNNSTIWMSKRGYFHVKTLPANYKLTWTGETLQEVVK